MIRKLWILLILGSISSYVHAQKQAANWYFGENAGLKFGGCGTNLLAARTAKIAKNIFK